ncbi:UNVERIFIED_CONTAM: Cation-chloride cotransporter 1 [Sesamum radiatum]|uniref:Cation-chloride cotransporter 1 n=1 Tax=Sesamum radiatum TaxID=300843 RepID=A0AAW2K408_SESRA
MFLISWAFTLVALALATLIYYYVSIKGKAGDWGDGFKSAYFQLALRSLRSLGANQVHPKNWYPIPLIFCRPWGKLPENVPCHPKLADFANCMKKKGRGMSIFVSILDGEYHECAEDAKAACRALSTYIEYKRCEGVAEIVVAPTMSDGFRGIVQTMGLGNLKPNIWVMRYPEIWRQENLTEIPATFVGIINDCIVANKAVVIVKGLDEWPNEYQRQYGTIDLFFCIAEEDSDAEELKADVKKFLYDLRMQAEVIVISMKSWDGQSEQQDESVEAFNGARERIATYLSEMKERAQKHGTPLMADGKPVVVNEQQVEKFLYTTLKLNTTILRYSRMAAVVLVSLPPPPLNHPAYFYMEYMDLLVENVPRLLIVRGYRRDVVTLFTHQTLGSYLLIGSPGLNLSFPSPWSFLTHPLSKSSIAGTRLLVDSPVISPFRCRHISTHENMGAEGEGGGGSSGLTRRRGCTCTKEDFLPEESFRSWSNYANALKETPARLVDRVLTRSSEQGELEVKARSEHDMKKTLNWWDLMWFGMGAVIGAGIFVLTGLEARDEAGPAVVLSYVVSGTSALLSVFCYTEFAVEIPVAGGSFAYLRVELGDFVAFIAAGNILLEYVIGGAAVARSWTSYFATLCNHKPDDFRIQAHNLPDGYNQLDPISIGIIIFVCILAVSSTKGSSRLNYIASVVHIIVIAFIIICGLINANVKNYTPFAPFGVRGIFKASAVLFFAYVGFDAVSTMAEETKNPGRDIPIGLVGSMVITTLIYCLLAVTLCLMAPYKSIDPDAPFSRAFETIGWHWAEYVVAAGALKGMTSVLLVGAVGQARYLTHIARTHMIPPWFAKVDPKTGTPINATVAMLAATAIIGLLFSPAIDQGFIHKFLIWTSNPPGLLFHLRIACFV